ncbi:MAG: hypothetical protein EA397_16410 [Deltaproteobacteria bacterium]|nr:MAG: hypothetical protein EA397_16410 [Deltaproteobacteria bacterium]
MLRTLSLAVLIGCAGQLRVNEAEQELGSDQVDQESELDTSRYDGASLRIVEPSSASFLPWGDSHTFRAEVRSAQGELLESVDEIRWSSSADVSWEPVEPVFSDDRLDVGLHDLTAEVQLPNGDRLAHTVGGVLVQAESAGTYVGTVTANFTLSDFPVNCAGTSTLVVDPYGELVDGTATCVGGLGDVEIPLDFVVEADHEAGDVDGVVAVRVMAFSLDFGSEGSLQGEDLGMDFRGELFGSDLNGRVRTRRISRDAGL